MRKGILYLLLTIILISCSPSAKNFSNANSDFLGKFEDDYGIEYRITQKQFIQEPNIVYNIKEWNTKEQYIIAQNASTNPSEQNLFTRIDYLLLEYMNPYTWGFCYTTYNSASVKIAKETAAADRNNPKKGCGGYPFSRMKKMD
jgi:hypothetical protein